MKEVFKLNESQTYDFRSQNTLKVDGYNTARYGKKELKNTWSTNMEQLTK